VAISDDGSSVLLSTVRGVYRVHADGSMDLVAAVGGAAVLAFLRGNQKAAIVDPASGAVYLWDGATGGAIALFAATGLTGIRDVRPSGDGGLWITEDGLQTVALLDLKTAQLRVFPVDVTPSTMDELAYRDVFLISSEIGEPGWIFLLQGGNPVTVLVPAVQPNRQSPSSHRNLQ